MDAECYTSILQMRRPREGQESCPAEIPDLSPWPSDSWDASLLCSRLLLQVSNWPLAPTPSQRVLMPLSVTHIPEGPTASASALHPPSLKETKVRAPP